MAWRRFALWIAALGALGCDDGIRPLEIRVQFSDPADEADVDSLRIEIFRTGCDGTPLEQVNVRRPDPIPESMQPALLAPDTYYARALGLAGECMRAFESPCVPFTVPSDQTGVDLFLMPVAEPTYDCRYERCIDHICVPDSSCAPEIFCNDVDDDCYAGTNDYTSDDLATVEHCGACHAACATDPSSGTGTFTAECVAGGCAYRCDDTRLTYCADDGGCVSVSSPERCGTCTDWVVCADPTPRCGNDDGVGAPECYIPCLPTETACPTASGGITCVSDFDSRVDFCGSCDTNCSVTVQNAVGVSCAAGVCDYGTCASTHADCDTNRANGCETPLGTNDDCADCGDACAIPMHASDVACMVGQCIPTCDSGFMTCKTLEPTMCWGFCPT